MFKKNARIASQADFSNFSKNKDAMKAKGFRMVKEQGNWLLVNLNEFATDAFWKAWRTRKAELKEKGYNVTHAYNMWIVY